MCSDSFYRNLEIPLVSRQTDLMGNYKYLSLQEKFKKNPNSVFHTYAEKVYKTVWVKRCQKAS